VPPFEEKSVWQGRLCEKSGLATDFSHDVVKATTMPKLADKSLPRWIAQPQFGMAVGEENATCVNLSIFSSAKAMRHFATRH
jgi:hypothetical protein